MIITHNGNILMNGGVVLNKIATSPSPSFLNQYSYNFDGVNDYVDTAITNTGTNDISISCWIKTTETFVYTDTRVAFGGYSNSGGSTYDLGRLGSGFATPNDMVVRVWNTLGSTKLNDGNWHNIIYTYDYTTKEVKAYVDGNTTAEATFTIASWNTNYRIAIGWDGITSIYHFEGNVDECAYWENIISASDITSIYNSGTPNDLTSLNPVAWWRMGENATWRDPQWLLPSNENKDKVSNYSMAFDGVNDVMTIGTIDFTNPFTVSLWVKWVANNIFDNTAGIIQFDKGSQVYSFAIGTGLGSSNDTIGVSWNNNHITFGSGYGDDAWHNIVVKGDGVNLSGVIYYIDGVDVTSIGTPVSNLGLQSTTSYVGKNTYAGDRYFKGNIDEISLWDKELSVSDVADIYNGGTPTTITGAVAHYRMGEDATFDGTNWTVPDNAGSNDGTSANMDISDRVGDAPDSINNALSINMVEVDRETDVPPIFNFKSLLFDGVNDYIDLGASSTVADGGQFSLSFWIKGTSQVGTYTAHYLFSADYYNLNTFWIITGTNLQWMNLNASKKDLSVGVLDDSWHHILIIWNPDSADSTIRCFTDGTNEVNVSTDWRFASSNPLNYNGALRYIGNRGGGTFNGFNGNVDEFAVWNNDQSANISSIYNGGTPNDLTSLNPVSWWRMGDADTFPTITDNGSGGNNGTMTNMDAGDIVSDTP